MASFMGMRGNADWPANQDPQSWRELMLYLYPNGSAPLTAMTALLASEKVENPTFNWWTKGYPSQLGTVTGVFTDTGLSSAYTSGGTAGTTLYVKMAEADANHFRAGHQVILRDKEYLVVDVNAKVTTVVRNGASSYIGAKLLEADDNGAGVSKDLSDADTVFVVGNINADGAVMPDALAYDPVQFTNKIQTFRTALDITRMARRTKLRTQGAYEEAKRESMELHAREIEMGLFFSIMTENTGSNGKPERTTMGIVPAIRTYASGNVSDYTLHSGSSGKTWLQGGWDWLMGMLELLFRFGDGEKLAYVGSEALLALNTLAVTYGQIQLRPMDALMGIKVTEWMTPFGPVYLKVHPLFAYDVAMRRAMVLLEPKRLKYNHVDDTTFYSQPQTETSAAHERYDATKEEWVTDCGLEYYFPETMGFLSGFGQANIV